MNKLSPDIAEMTRKNEQIILHLLSVFVEKKQGEFFIEEFKSWALDRGLDQPQHYQAWGGLTTGACKHGLITLVRKDAAKSTARTGHDLCVWRRA